MVYIGIDPGKHTGIAVWSSKQGRLIHVETMAIHRAMDLVLQWKETQGENVFVIFEDARQRKYFGQTSREVLQGAGSVKRDATIWEDFLRDHKISFRAVPPAKGATKWDAERFKKVTCWNYRTSEHSRDAAMLVYGR